MVWWKKAKTDESHEDGQDATVEETVDQDGQTGIAETAEDQPQVIGEIQDLGEAPEEDLGEMPWDAEQCETTPDFTAPANTMTTGYGAAASPVRAPVKKTTGHGARNTVLTAVGSVLGAVLLIVGCGAIGTSYFDNHAKPGTELAGRDITGFSLDQVRNVAATIIENYTATLELDGKQAEAGATSLGITFDLDKTVGAAMSAGSTAVASDRYNPFNAKHALLAMSVDEEKLQSYLNDTFISDEQRSTPANVVYDADQGGFTVQPGKDGTQADASAVAQALKDGRGIGEVLPVATTPESPRVTDDAAQQAAYAANQLLAIPYTVTAASKSFTIPASSIAAWVRFIPDEYAGTIAMRIDEDQARADLPAILLSDDLKQPVVAQQTLVSADGRALGVQKSGAEGTEIADPDAVAAEIVQALVAGSGYSGTVATKASPFPSEQVQVGADQKWVEINRANGNEIAGPYTVTRWEGATKLSTWSVVVGKPGTPTYPGIFHVWAKVRIQDMKGADYLQPDVPWIAYFNGDIALHGNYWVGGFGWASSHGCVGMPPAQAEIMYNWIDVGTLVVVHN